MRRAIRIAKIVPIEMYKALISIALTIIVFYLVFLRADVSGFETFLDDFTAESFLGVFALLAAGVGFSVWRLKLIAYDLGYSITIRDALAALSLGQIAGSLFFQIVGQLMARGAVLGRRGIPVAATVTLTIYERVAAACVSLLLAVAGGWYIFGRVTLDVQHGGLVFLKIIAGLLLALLAGAAFGWGEKAFRVGMQHIERVPVWPIARNVIVSSVIQLTTLSAYILAATTIAPTISLLDLAAASAVVMLAASLPISLAGWGVRELSAVLVLGIVGMNSQAALVVAVLIGVTSLIVLGACAVVSFWLAAGEAKVASAPYHTTVDYKELLDWAVPTLAATAVFFQLHIPVGQSELNVNLADPLAILGGVLFLLSYALYERRWPQWRISRFNTHIIIISLVLTLALLIGYRQVGWTSWAVANRYSGWFILLGFGASAALLVHRAGREGLLTLLRTFAAVGCAVVVLDLFLTLMTGFGVRLPRSVLYFRLEGFAQNPNAFAFQILMALCAVLAADFRNRIATGMVAICLAGIWYSASRAAFLTLPVVLGLALYMRVLSLRQLLTAAAITAAIIAMTFFTPTVAAFTVTFVKWVISALQWFVNWLVAGGAWLIEQLWRFALRVLSDPQSLFQDASENLPSAPREPKQAASIKPLKLDSLKFVPPAPRFNILEAVWTSQSAYGSNAERLESLRGGLQLFFNHPLLGAGLGTFVATRIKEYGAPLVIHSTPLWLLAETGLIGFLAFVALVMRILRAEIGRSVSKDPATVTLLLCIAAFGIFSCVHEIMYQRGFWLLSGAALALSAARATQDAALGRSKSVR